MGAFEAAPRSLQPVWWQLMGARSRPSAQYEITSSAEALDWSASTPMLFLELRRHLGTMYRILDRGHGASCDCDAHTVVAGLTDSLSSLARTARAMGLTTYSSIALHVLEQLASAKRTGYMPIDVLGLMQDWVRLSTFYLAAPMRSVHAVELVEHLGNRRWERPVCRVQREALLHALQEETPRAIQSERRVCM